MNNEKIKAVMDEVAAEAAERDDLIQCIAIALLAKKNLFILGDTGQAKSYCINAFRKRITGAKQFERLMSKQTDEEQLFGRLDLSSIIPGNMPHSELEKDTSYIVKLNEVKKAYEQYEIDAKDESLKKAHGLAKELGAIKEIVCAVKDTVPKIITEGKIPDSHIIFLDEIFKSNDGILNSLLTALNERVYTNEGQTMKIPAISFFSASNEIPDFSEPENQILKPLYDRFDLKVVTEYVAEKANRQAILKQKQSPSVNVNPTTITLKELQEMQNEVKRVKVPDSINELMDDILCALRRKDVHISDRKFFNYTPIVQAAAYINGHDTVSAEDLMILKNYFWTTPAERDTISAVLTEICDNPIQSRINDLIAIFAYNNEKLRKHNDSLLVEKYSDVLDKDKFFKTDSGFTHVYYNPDATAGGQLVYNEISHSLIWDALADDMSCGSFFEYLGSACKQYLVDIGTEDFHDSFMNFVNNKAEFEGCSETTMHSLQEAAYKDLYSYSVDDNKVMTVMEGCSILCTISDVREETAEDMFREAVFEMRGISLDDKEE